jgi:hypothetical protein
MVKELNELFLDFEALNQRFPLAAFVDYQYLQPTS